MEIIRPDSKQPIPDDAKKVFKGVLFDVYQWEQKLFDGTTTTFEKLKRPDTVTVYPVLDDGKILLLQQEQPGKTNVFTGTPGGRVDEGEDVLTAAKRELLEETGYEAREYVLWNAQHPTSKLDWVVYTFIAKGLTKVKAQKLDAGEKITLMPVNFDTFLDVAIEEKFIEKEMVPKFFEAKINPEKKAQLQELFKPL